MATEKDFSWEDDLMTKSYQRQESHLAKLSLVHGKDYGKPVAGSASEKRSQEYQRNVVEEVASLCYQISLHGYKAADGTEQILFGDLFKLNEKISNKCVGLLQRARKYRLLHFAGETLWQGADDKVVISLLRRNREIQVYFTHTKRLLPNNPAGNTWLQVAGERRVHQDWVSDVREVDPWTLSYLVTVEAPRQAEQLRMPSLECAPLGPAAPAAAATEYTEPEVVFRLREATVHVASLLCCPHQVDCQHLSQALPCPAYCPQNETKAGVSIVENEIVGKCVRSCLQVKRCAREQTSPPRIFIRDREREPRRPERVRPPSPPRAAVPRPKLELNLAPPPPLERVERVRAELPEVPRLKIKFSTCTTLYKPARPCYEDFKKVRIPRKKE